MGGFFSTLLEAEAEAEHYIQDDGWRLGLKSLALYPKEFQDSVRFQSWSSTSVQVTHDSTVESAALSKQNRKILNFHALHRDQHSKTDRRLDLEKSLEAQNVGCRSTNVVISRRSGGGHKKSDVEPHCMTFLDRMNELPSKDEWIEKKRSACVLGKLGRQTFHKLFEMVSLHHAGNKSLNGKFTYDNIIYVPSADCYKIGRCPLVVFTPGGYKKDIKALGKVLTKVCMMKMESSQENIAYVAHLLKTMEDMPTGAEHSNTFKAFLRNHPCMMSAASRQGLILEVHRHIKVQPRCLRDKMNSVLNLNYEWGHIAIRVAAFKAVYTYLSGTSYHDKEMSWFRFCRNFLSHPPKGYQSVEYADSAIWCNFKEHLADFLCRLSCTHEFKINVFDKDYFCTHPTGVKATTQSWPKQRRQRARGRKHSEADHLCASKT
ncbi:unnamed protein product [Alopecurus aequalis]